MKSNRILYRLLSVIMAFCMAVDFMPITAYAAANTALTDWLDTSSGSATGYFTYSNHFYKVEWTGINTSQTSSVRLAIDNQSKIAAQKNNTYSFISLCDKDYYDIKESAITGCKAGNSVLLYTSDGNLATGAGNDIKKVCTITCVAANSPEWNWTEDYSSATATFTCTANTGLTATVNASVTTSGNTKTASVTFNGTTYTDTKSVYQVTYQTSNGITLHTANDDGTLRTLPTAEQMGVVGEPTFTYNGSEFTATTEISSDVTVTVEISGFSLAFSLANITADKQSETAIPYTADFITTLTAETGYALPAGSIVKVGGVALESDESTYTYDATTGTLTIKQAAITGPVSIEASGVQYTVTYQSKSGINIKTVQWGGAGFDVAANSGLTGEYTYQIGGETVTGAQDITADVTVVVTDYYLSEDMYVDGSTYAINMPRTGTKYVTIPLGVTSFKVYDDGGSTGRYTENCNGTLTLTAPTDYVLRVTGSVTTEGGNKDYLQVHDGGSTSTRQLGKFYSGSNGTLTDITICQSSGNQMTLYFKSNSNTIFAGLDLTVELINAKSFSNATISGISDSYMLTGENIKPEPIVTDAMHNVLTKGTDYTLTWSGDGTTVGTYTVTATGMGDYSGTISKSYAVKVATLTISSPDDWNTFATNVSSGTTYSGEIVKLTADISGVTTTVGAENKPFSGTFDGNGHTLTAAISSTATGTGFDEQGVAPFHYINGATIKNLTVSGTIASASFHTAGIVGFADGTNTIENCKVTATLNLRSNYAGGIIGHGRNSATTIKDCVFAGTFMGVDSNRANIGGIWGWSDGGTPTLQNCLENGTYTNISSMHPMGLQKAAGTITACYHVNAQIGSPSNVCTVSGAARAYADQESGYSYKELMLFGNTYYQLAFASGSGTEADPYLIANAVDWNTFAAVVDEGKSFSGEFVKLTDNITVSTMLGTSSNPFQGTFDGNGHTLTVTYDDVTEDYAAPFRYVNAATIQNLKVAGTISTSEKYAASIIGNGEGAYKIQNCEGNVTITSTVNGDGTHGGLVGVSNGGGTITNCSFTGSISGANTHSCGGIIGWSNAAATLTNVLQAGTFNIGTSGCNTISRGAAPVCNNVYYLNAIGDVNGTQVTTVQMESGEICYLLNGSTSDGTLAWHQTIDTDDMPQLFGESKVVYYQNSAYTNTPTFTVTLHTNEGTINSGNVTTYTYGIGVTLPTDITREGYTFGGWYDNSELTGDAVTAISTTDMGDKEYWAKWTIKNYAVGASSILNGSDTTVANITGGGTYYYGDSVTLTAPSVIGYNFVGWFNKGESNTYNATVALSISRSYTINSVTDNGNYVAVYEKDESASKITLTVNGSGFTVKIGEGAETGNQENNYTNDSVSVGESITITATSDKFADWKNDSNKIVSKSASYTFVITGNTTLTMDVSATSGTNVIWLSHSNQIMKSETYTTGNLTASDFPVGPSRPGYIFKGWKIEGDTWTSDADTALAINAKIDGETHTLKIVPEYAEDDTKATVTVILHRLIRRSSLC